MRTSPDSSHSETSTLRASSGRADRCKEVIEEKELWKWDLTLSNRARVAKCMQLLNIPVELEQDTMPMRIKSSEGRVGQAQRAS